ncbi:MAG: CDP-alcohol phosphatidyltransferase family protein [Thermoanaerobaculia bacterium]
MPSIYDLKLVFQDILRPLTGALVRAGVTANQVTVAALLLSLAVGGSIYLWPARSWPLLLLPVCLFLRMALNAVDGMIAREHDQQTALGAILNEIGDVVSDAALYLPLAVVPGLPPVLVVTAVVLAGVTEMVGVVAVQIGASRRYDGPMGKSDRAFVFGALGLALGLGAPRGLWVDAVLALVVALLTVTVVHRARKALGELR